MVAGLGTSREILGDRMKAYRWVLFLILVVAVVQPASAQQRVIVRDKLGLGGIKLTCLVLNCQGAVNLGDPSGELFVLTFNDSLNLNSLLSILSNQVGIVDAEVDQQIFLIGGAAGPIPESLLDNTPVPYYGATVWDGYANQPAAQIVRVQQAQNTFHVTGAGIVAMIDTGVDTQHPALVPVLVPGYNFINDTPNADETSDINQSSAALLDAGSPAPAFINASTVAVINQSSAALLDGGGYSGFGH